MTASLHAALLKTLLPDRVRAGEIRALTGIRGLAAIGVMAFHYWGVGWVSVASLGGHACARGYISVDLFFLLSGFVMAKAYGSGFMQRWTWKDYFAFINMRLARIYPVYFAVVLVMVGVTELRPHHASSVSPIGLIANLLLIQSWCGIRSYVLVAWSLSTEWAAYIVFPILVRILLQSRVGLAWLACACAAIVIVSLEFYGIALGKPIDFALDADFPVPGELLRCFAGFIIGMCVYRLAMSQQTRIAEADWFAAGSIGLLMLLWMVRGVPDLFVYACFPLLLLCLASNKRMLPTLFGNKFVFTIGEWSYSIYLTHIFFFVYGRQQVFSMLSRHLPSPLADTIDALLFLALTVTVSAACFMLIEVPARRKLRLIMNARRSSLSLEPSAP